MRIMRDYLLRSRSLSWFLMVLSLQTRTARADEPGGVYCYDLRKCNGMAGCALGGEIIEGCEIRCEGGGKATCDPIQD